MMTFREARQRLEQCSMSISKVKDSAPQEYRVSFPEDSWREAEKNAYYTDDLTDAAVSGADMRNRRNAQLSSKVDEPRASKLAPPKVEKDRMYVSVWEQRA